MYPPLFSDITRFLQAGEPILAQAFVASFSIERFNKRILNRLSGLDVIERDVLFLCPLLRVLAPKFWPIVACDLLRLSIAPKQSF
jgi:hypothetical protein